MHFKTSFMFLLLALTSGIESVVDINPNFDDPTTNLDFWTKMRGSTDAQVSTTNYMNGSIFAKLPGKGLQKLFNFEGYSIQRTILQEDGSYMWLERDFAVYRDPSTHAIQTVWTNPWTGKQNEVFYVANYQSSRKQRLGRIIPIKMIPGDRIVFNADILLNYPNPLQPSIYPTYSAGPVYQTAHLSTHFTNLTSLLVNDTHTSSPTTSTLIRRSQFLPWMQMGTTEGYLYYVTFVWKCEDERLQCVADDIMAIINENFTQYKEAPVKAEVPNKTTWRVFKDIVDKRRVAGLPDIIIPQSHVPDPQNVSQYEASVDQRVTEFFQREKNIHVYLNGSAWSQIIGNQSVKLFNVEGNVLVTVTESADSGFYIVSVRGAVFYRDIETGDRLLRWHNPLTGTQNDVPNPLVLKEIQFKFPKDFVYSMAIPTTGDIGLIAAQSSEASMDAKSSSVNFLEVIFDRTTFGDQSDVFFFGTAAKFSDWPVWMEMGNIPGNTAIRANIYRDSQNFPYEGLFANKGVANCCVLYIVPFAVGMVILFGY